MQDGRKSKTIDLPVREDDDSSGGDCGDKNDVTNRKSSA